MSLWWLVYVNFSSSNLAYLHKCLLVEGDMNTNNMDDYDDDDVS